MIPSTVVASPVESAQDRLLVISNSKVTVLGATGASCYQASNTSTNCVVSKVVVLEKTFDGAGNIFKFNLVTIPKLEATPLRRVQYRSEFLFLLAKSEVPSAVTTFAAIICSDVRPHVLVRIAHPPPVASPEIPTVRHCPTGVKTFPIW